MESKQARVLFLLCIALVALLTVNRFWEAGDEPDDPTATHAIWDLEISDVARFAIDDQGVQKLFVVSEGDWSVLSPVVIRGDKQVIESLLYDLVRAEFGVPVGDDAKPADFGLDPPRATITLTDTQGAEHVLKVGMTVPIGFRTYVQTADGVISAVDGQFEKQLVNDVELFRDKRVFFYDPGKVIAVSIDSANGLVEVRKHQKDWWLSGYAHADVDRVATLIESLPDLRFDQHMPPPVEGHILEPKYSVTVEFEEDDAVVFEVGDQTPMGTFSLVVGGDAGMIHPASLALLGQGPMDLGEKHAFPVKPYRLERVNVSLGGKTWSLDKVEGGWNRDGVLEPQSDNGLRAMGEATVHLRAEPVPDLGEIWGTVTISEAVLSRTIDIGQREGSQWRVAKDRNGGGTFLIPVADLDALAGAFEPSDDPTPGEPQDGQPSGNP